MHVTLDKEFLQPHPPPGPRPGTGALDSLVLMSWPQCPPLEKVVQGTGRSLLDAVVSTQVTGRADPGSIPPTSAAHLTEGSKELLPPGVSQA